MDILFTCRRKCVGISSGSEYISNASPESDDKYAKTLPQNEIYAFTQAECLKSTEQQPRSKNSGCAEFNSEIPPSLKDEYKSIASKNKKKVSRPCLYCGVFQTKLTRHTKTVHKNEDKVKRILDLNPKEQKKKFNLLRKQGICEYILKLLKENKPQHALEVKRKQNEDKTTATKLKISAGCKAFVNSKYYSQHWKILHVLLLVKITQFVTLLWALVQTDFKSMSKKKTKSSSTF